MKSGTHISIPTKYDLLLNQEIVLLSEIKKISKNELINLIYHADYSYIFNYLNLNPEPFILSPLSDDFYYKFFNNIIQKNLKDSKRYDFDKVFNDAKIGKKTSIAISEKINFLYNLNMKKNIQSYLDRQQIRMYNKFFDPNSYIPNIQGTSRVYIRCEKGSIDKKELESKLKSYFRLPLALRECYIFINNPIIKALFDEINNPKEKRMVSIIRISSIIPGQEHSCFKIIENNTTKYLDLNNKKLDSKNLLSSKNKPIFITKEIKVTNKESFFECLKYFINRIFIISNDNDIYTITGTEKDIFFFEKMIY